LAVSWFKRNQTIVDAKLVLLLDSDPERGSALKRGLLDSGYRLAERLTTAVSLLKQVEIHQPDIMVIGIDEPDDVILQQLLLIHDYCPVPVIMFAEKEAPKLIEKIVRAGVNGFVVNDIQAHRIRPIIDIATARFIESQKLRTELIDTKSKLENRKRIEKAKGLLMQGKGLSEDEAYQSMRKMAMDRGKSLADVADTIIDVFDLMGEKN
tara:strand:- start:4750 stop:5376 length:627 start_codon:yes stop_codon:yes gene_type:complete